MSFSFYDILKENSKSSESPDSRYGSYGIVLNEAPEDDNSGAESSGGDDFSIDADTDSGNDNNQDSGDDLDMGSLDDSIDTSDDSSSTENNSSSSSDSGTSSQDNTSEDKPVEANTDIFSSLTAEEQAIKIKELKKLFGNLYSRVNELLDRVNDLEVSETNKYAIDKISEDLCDIKTTIADYILYIFNTKSYIENDIAFNRFLSDINYIASILEKLQKIEEKEELS